MWRDVEVVGSSPATGIFISRIQLVGGGMIDSKTAQKILYKHDLGKLTSFKKHETGITGSVFELNGKYILKVQIDATDNFRPERNAFICRILNKHGIKAPHLIAVD